VRLATEHAPRLEAGQAAISAAEAEASRASALPDPMLMVGIENLPITGADAFDPGEDDMTMKRVGLRQEFPAAAKREARRKLAERRLDEARAEALGERRTVQRAAAEAWIEAWAAGEQLAVLEDLRGQARLAAKLAHARVAAGGSAAEALTAEAAKLEIDNLREEVGGERDAALAELRRWLPSLASPEPASPPDFGVLPLGRAQLRARLDETSPILASSARVETAAAAIEAARAEKRLDWSISAAYGQRDRDRSDMFSVEVAVPLPLFARNRQDRGVLAREADYRQALALREDARRALAAQVDAAFARWEALKRQVALHEDKLLPLARDRTAMALAAYRAGGELQPWLDARAAELEVHRAHAGHLGELGRVWAALAFLLPENTP
jgi:outer membrane protein TolC